MGKRFLFQFSKALPRPRPSIFPPIFGGKTQRLDFTVFQISSIYSKYSKCYPNILCPRSTFYFFPPIFGKQAKRRAQILQFSKAVKVKYFKYFKMIFPLIIGKEAKRSAARILQFSKCHLLRVVRIVFRAALYVFLRFYKKGETIQEFGTFTFIEKAFTRRMAILLRIMLFSRRKVFLKIDGHISLQNVVGILYFQSLSNNSTTFVMEFCIAYLEQTSFRNIINLRSNLLLASSYFFMDFIKM